MIDPDKVREFLDVCVTLRSGLSCQLSESTEGFDDPTLLIDHAIALDGLIKACSFPEVKKAKKS